MLKDVVIESASVSVGGQPTDFYGLTFFDISTILLENRESLSMIFTVAERAGIKDLSSFTEQSISEVGFRLLAECPELVARIIAVSCKEPAEWEKARDLPAPKQLEIMREVTRLTLIDGLAFGDFVGNVVAAVMMMKKTLPQVTTKVLTNMIPKNSTMTENP